MGAKTEENSTFKELKKRNAQRMEKLNLGRRGKNGRHRGRELAENDMI